MVAQTIDRSVDLHHVGTERVHPDRFDEAQPSDDLLRSSSPEVTAENFAVATTTEDRTWQRYAACAGMPEATQLFFSDDLHDVSQAKLICASCPVMAPCLEGALDRHEQWGVWGGQLFANGKVVLSKRRRGRPPKQVRPEDQLPVIPFPAHLQDRLRIA